MDKNLKDLIDTVGFIKDNMITRDDFERLETKVDGIEETLSDHSRDLDIIKGDVKSNLDKRMQLEVKVATLEQKVH